MNGACCLADSFSRFLDLGVGVSSEQTEQQARDEKKKIFNHALRVKMKGCFKDSRTHDLFSTSRGLIHSLDSPPDLAVKTDA